MVAVKQELYDPMVYDVMRERANRLGGEYLYLKRHAVDPLEAEQWARLKLELARRVRAIDSLDEAAVRAASAEFSMRLRELERLSVAAG